MRVELSLNVSPSLFRSLAMTIWTRSTPRKYETMDYLN